MSERSINLRPIQEVIERLEKDRDERMRNSVRYWEDLFKERIRNTELNRQALALLDAAGINMHLPRYSDYEIEVNLGFFARGRAGNKALADVLRLIRTTLDCSLGEPIMGLDHNRTGCVLLHYKPVDFPGLEIIVSRKLGKDCKCRIKTVKSAEKRLVCNL